MTTDWSFYELCAAELCIVLIGLVNFPVAVLFQILIPLIIFPGFIVHHHLYQPALFIASFALGTIGLAALLLLFRNTLIPLLVIAVFAMFSLFTVRIAENRLKVHYRGAS
jgi:hypothetical protein